MSKKSIIIDQLYTAHMEACDKPYLETGVPQNRNDLVVYYLKIINYDIPTPDWAKRYLK